MLAALVDAASKAARKVDGRHARLVRVAPWYVVTNGRSFPNWTGQTRLRDGKFVRERRTALVDGRTERRNAHRLRAQCRASRGTFLARWDAVCVRARAVPIRWTTKEQTRAGLSAHRRVHLDARWKVGALSRGLAARARVALGRTCIEVRAAGEPRKGLFAVKGTVEGGLLAGANPNGQHARPSVRNRRARIAAKGRRFARVASIARVVRGSGVDVRVIIGRVAFAFEADQRCRISVVVLGGARRTGVTNRHACRFPAMAIIAGTRGTRAAWNREGVFAEVPKKTAPRNTHRDKHSEPKNHAGNTV